MNLKKLLFKPGLFRIILFVILSSVLVFFINIFLKEKGLLTNSNKTYVIPSDWKEYKNDVFSFQLRYPDNWIIRENKYSNKEESFTSILIYPPIGNNMDASYIKSGGYPFGALSISISDKVHSESELNKTGIEELIFTKTKSEKLIFKNIKSKKTYTTSTDSPSRDGDTWIKFNYGSYGWTISYLNIDLKGKHDEIYDQILSSLLFN